MKTAIIVTSRLLRSNTGSSRAVGNANQFRQFASSSGSSSTGMIKNMAMFGVGKSSAVIVLAQSLPCTK
jgi:hypothetical protein